MNPGFFQVVRSCNNTPFLSCPTKFWIIIIETFIYYDKKGNHSIVAGCKHVFSSSLRHVGSKVVNCMPTTYLETNFFVTVFQRLRPKTSGSHYFQRSFFHTALWWNSFFDNSFGKMFSLKEFSSNSFPTEFFKFPEQSFPRTLLSGSASKKVTLRNLETYWWLNLHAI